MTQILDKSLTGDLLRWHWRPEARGDKACANDVIDHALAKWLNDHPGRKPRIIVSEKWGGLAAYLKERLGSMVIVGEVKPSCEVAFVDGGEA